MDEKIVREVYERLGGIDATIKAMNDQLARIEQRQGNFENEEKATHEKFIKAQTEIREALIAFKAEIESLRFWKKIMRSLNGAAYSALAALWYYRDIFK